MKRKLAREAAFKVVYKSLFLKDNFSTVEIIEEDKIDEDNIPFVNELVELYRLNRDEITKLIDSNLQGYTPERVYKVDRAIISIALAEILYYKNTPYKVVINEAVEMAKKYSTEKSYSFVNGLLKKVIEGANVI